ncbi:MAG: hypothetical protein J6S21_08320 [Victivallales bacterium]|nr:hypothetical protein [Victivallales bacterium]
MSNTISITASKRDLKGSANSRRLRAAGQVPAVVYSRGAENILLQANIRHSEDRASLRSRGDRSRG